MPGNGTISDAFLNHGVFCQGGALTFLGWDAVGESFIATWIAFTLLGLFTVFMTSGPLFYYYYWPGKVNYFGFLLSSKERKWIWSK